MKHAFIKLIASFSILVATASCYASRIDGPYEGRIIDADTGQPIEGVVVLGTWSRVTVTPGGGVSNYYDAMETVTNKNGDFKIKGLGLLVISNVAPMDIIIFKAGYEYHGLMTWASLKEDIALREIIKWEETRAIIPIRKITAEERKKDPLYPPMPPTETPLNKVRALLKEINNDLVNHGHDPMTTWGGKKI